MSSHVALVTGASRGIGRAIALALARRGHPVAINHRASADDAKETLTAIEGAGGEAVIVQADVAAAPQVDAMFDEVEDRLGAVSILINNAGIRRDALALRMRDDDWDEVLRTNLSGAFICARRALRPMVRERWGRIVNVTSVAGLRGIPGQANYCAAKAGLIGLTKALAAETAKRGITVNAVAPGLVDTELTRSLSPERFAELESFVASGRAGTPEDIAGVVAFLCSDEAAYINGSVLPIDGAMTA
jgi:3-oxoacyl-[acyl-carrier protein] reductase